MRVCPELRRMQERVCGVSVLELNLHSFDFLGHGGDCRISWQELETGMQARMSA